MHEMVNIEKHEINKTYNFKRVKLCIQLRLEDNTENFLIIQIHLLLTNNRTI